MSNKCGGGRRGNSVPARSRLCDQPGFSHPPCKQRLTQHIVDPVRTGMIEILALEIDFCATQIFCHLFA